MLPQGALTFGQELMRYIVTGQAGTMSDSLILRMYLLSQTKDCRCITVHKSEQPVF